MEVKPGYKQTEVGVIPEEWEVEHLATCRDQSRWMARTAECDSTRRYRSSSITRFEVHRDLDATRRIEYFTTTAIR